MMIRRIKGCTETIGADQGYLGLPIRMITKPTLIGGVTHQCAHVETAWEPTPKELERMIEGHPVIVSLLHFGGGVPPQMIYVDSEPLESGEDNKFNRTKKEALRYLEDVTLGLEGLQKLVSNHLDEQSDHFDKTGKLIDQKLYQTATDDRLVIQSMLTYIVNLADRMKGAVIE